MAGFDAGGCVPLVHAPNSNAIDARLKIRLKGKSDVGMGASKHTERPHAVLAAQSACFALRSAGREKGQVARVGADAGP